MEIKFDKIVIRNFKNLRNVEIHPKKLNVLVGPNGAGKSNFIEFFKFLKKIYVEDNPYPFLDWGGYHNIVWMHEIGNPIEFGFSFSVESNLEELMKSYEIYGLFRKHKYVSKSLSQKIKIKILFSYFSKIHATELDKKKILETTISMTVESFEFHISFRIEGDKIYMSLNGNKYVDFEKIKNVDMGKKDKSLVHFLTKNLIRTLKYMGSMKMPSHLYPIGLIHEDILLSKKDEREIKRKIKKWLKDEYNLEENYANSYTNYIYKKLVPGFFKIFSQIFEYIKNIIFLFPINVKEIKYRPNIFPMEEPIKERGENVLDILVQLQFRDGTIPDRIDYFVNNFFNGKIYFKGEGVGKMNMYYSNGFVEVSKENLPDGLFKGLVILTSLEQKPYILLIDEIENSLHPELIEFLIGVLKNDFDGYVFLSTHSPIVLNLVDPENIWVFKPEPENGEIVIKNATEYKNRKDLEKELNELGISLGEKVLYGFM